MLEALVLLITASASPDIIIEQPVSPPAEIQARNVSVAIRLAAENPGRTICTRVKKTGSRLSW